MGFVVREQTPGDMGGSRKTINDNKGGYKDKVSSKKYGKGGGKKDAEQKPRSPWHAS